jgi:hypothetical protein
MEALQMLKFSFKSRSSVLSFTSGTSKEEEEVILEEVTMERSVIPEDIHSFIDSLGCVRN